MTAGVAVPGPDPRRSTDPWRSHIRTQQVEDVRFLTATGLPLTAALDRVGVSAEAWQKWTEKGYA